MEMFTAKRFGFEHCDKTHFKNFPAELQETMIKANCTYVSLPSVDPLCPSPQATGGAVDVWLFKNGQAEDLGVPFDWMGEEAGAFYQIGLTKRVRQNREILLSAMTKAGFSCYPPEIWHFNYGNQMDALVKGGCAIYSYIQP